MEKNKEDSFIPFKEPSISVGLYFKDVRKHKKISNDEQIELAIKAKNGDRLAEKKLIETNQRFIIKIAREYIKMANGMELEDLISEANIGLIRSIKKFDETRGVGFLSYSVWWIRQAVLESIYNSNLVRLPANKINLINKLNKIREHFNIEHNRDPDIEEACYNTNLSPSEVRDIFDGNTAVSLDGFASEEEDSIDNCSLMDFIPNSEFNDLEYSMQKKSLISEISKIFKTKLSERESDILSMYFGLNGCEQKTLKEIGKIMKLTNERVRQIKSNALKKMRGFNNIGKLVEYFKEENF